MPCIRSAAADELRDMANASPVDHPQLENDVDLAARGDLSAGDRVMVTLRPLLDAQLHRFRLRPEDHLDVLQDALLRVQQHLGDYRGESRFVTWATRVTINEALMHLRSERRFRARLEDGGELDVEAIPAPLVEDAFDGTGVRAALESLPPTYRHVLRAHYGEDLPIAVIASELRTTKGSVRSSLLRARRMLRGHFRKTGIASFAEARASL